MTDIYFLLEYPIYRDFEAGDIDALSVICEAVTLKKGQELFKEGSAGDAMYIVKKGNIKIYKENDNRKKLITLISEGEFFGEMSLIEGAPRSATAVAGEDAELIRLGKEGFERLKTDYSAAGFKVLGVILKFMSQRIRRTTTKAAKLIKGRKKKIRKKSQPKSVKRVKLKR
mgnify:CR=1 FL=1